MDGPPRHSDCVRPQSSSSRPCRLLSAACSAAAPTYVAGTRDEKQYRVVKDRERWFGVLMGGRVPDDERSKDRLADRVPLPVELLEELVLDLSVWSPV